MRACRGGRGEMPDDPIPVHAGPGHGGRTPGRRGETPDEPIPVRLSHLLRYCAVGAVVRGPDYLVTVQDTNAWNCGPDHEIKYVDQVRAALGIGKTLRSPPMARVDNGELTGCPIPATRFPGWMRCSTRSHPRR